MDCDWLMIAIEQLSEYVANAAMHLGMENMVPPKLLFKKKRIKKRDLAHATLLGDMFIAPGGVSEEMMASQAEEWLSRCNIAWLYCDTSKSCPHINQSFIDTCATFI